MHFELIETEWRISTSANKVIICSDAGLLVAFIWTNAGWSSTRPIATNQIKNESIYNNFETRKLILKFRVQKSASIC